MCDCEQSSIQARKVEPLVWGFVSGVLKEPEHLRRYLEKMIALQREGKGEGPDREAKAWAEKLAEVQQTLPLPGYGRRGTHHLRRVEDEARRPS